MSTTTNNFAPNKVLFKICVLVCQGDNSVNKDFELKYILNIFVLYNIYIPSFMSSSLFLTSPYSPLIWKVNMLKTYSESSSMRQTCSICGRTLCRIGLTDLPSRSRSWTQQLRRVSLFLGNKGSGSFLNTQWPSASQFVPETTSLRLHSSSVRSIPLYPSKPKINKK